MENKISHKEKLLSKVSLLTQGLPERLTDLTFELSKENRENFNTYLLDLAFQSKLFSRICKIKYRHTYDYITKTINAVEPLVKLCQPDELEYYLQALFLYTNFLVKEKTVSKNGEKRFELPPQEREEVSFLLLSAVIVSRIFFDNLAEENKFYELQVQGYLKDYREVMGNSEAKSDTEQYKEIAKKLAESSYLEPITREFFAEYAKQLDDKIRQAQVSTFGSRPNLLSNKAQQFQINKHAKSTSIPTETTPLLLETNESAYSDESSVTKASVKTSPIPIRNNPSKQVSVYEKSQEGLRHRGNSQNQKSGDNSSDSESDDYLSESPGN